MTDGDAELEADPLGEGRRLRLAAVTLKTLREFTIVVFGVIMALAVDSYVGLRRERSLEVGYLNRLAGDIRANQAELEVMVKNWTFFASSAEDVLAFVTSSEPATDPSALLISSVFAAAITMPNLASPTYEELVGSASLRIVRSPEARQVLVEYQRTLTFGDPYLERLQQTRDYDAVVLQTVPARIGRFISANCFQQGEVVPCSPPVSAHDAQTYLNQIRSVPTVRGALNWRLADAIRAAEIFQVRIDQGQGALELIEALVPDQR